MITIEHLNAGYGHNLVIRDLNWNLEDNRIHGLIGLNGSGKTTLLKCMSKLHKPASGQILINGHEISRHEVSLLQTEPYFYSGITGNEFLNLFKSPGNAEFDDRAWAELMSVPLDSIIDGYSTGMKKKLALIMTIKLNRDVILLDEPFNGLDLESSRILTTVLKKLVRMERVIILTSHILDSLTGLCDKIHYLNEGRISRTFDKEETGEIENEVFKVMDEKINNQIRGLM